MYLAISNPGIADYRAFTLIGASGSRNCGRNGTIGQFGSGSKYSIALLLRMGVQPVIYCGNLRCEFFTKPVKVSGVYNNQVCVKYSGKDVDGSTNNRTDELGFVAEFGEINWTNSDMALREFIANAIDGCIAIQKDHNSISISVVENMRAKADHTIVYLPYTSDIQASFMKMPNTFLHLSDDSLLQQKYLPKKDKKTIRVYKNGVLTTTIEGKSYFDYNFGNELILDESRNTDSWKVKSLIAFSISQMPADKLADIIKNCANSPDYLEGNAEVYYATHSMTEEKRKTFASAFKAIAADAVISRGISHIDAYIHNKGIKTFPVTETWYEILKAYGITRDMDILDADEQSGNVVSGPTEDAIKARDWAWALLESLNLTNAREKPEVKGFTTFMQGGTETNGYYRTGGKTIYLRNDIGYGKRFCQTALEECVHYVTGASDLSIDFEKFLLKLAIEIAF
jgi:hypothetical protein